MPEAFGQVQAAVQEKLRVLVGTIRREAPGAEAVYLFGSYAYGTPRPDSDLDVYVVLSDSEPRKAKQAAVDILLGLPRPFGMPLDLKCEKRSDFEARLGKPTLQRIVSQKGVRLL